MLYEYWQTLGSNHLSKKKVPLFDHPLSKEMFPNALSKPFPGTTLCCSHTSHHHSLRRGDWHFPFHFHFSGNFREQWSHLSVSSRLGKWCPQLLLTGYDFQHPYQLCFPTVGAFKFLTILFISYVMVLHTMPILNTIGESSLLANCGQLAMLCLIHLQMHQMHPSWLPGHTAD